MLQQIVLGNPISRWLIALSIVLGALVLGRLGAALVSTLLRRLKSELASLLATGFSGPLSAIGALIGIRIAAESLVLPVGANALLEKGATFLSVLTITWLASNLYDAIHQGIFLPYARRPDSALDVHLFTVLRTVLNVVIWLVGLASAMNSVGFEVSAILAGLGIGGMALALASQDTVANVFGGLLVLTQRPFRMGDRIEVAGVNGWVHQFGLRNTIVKNWYGRDVLIPNKKFTDSIVINIDSQKVYFQEARLRLDPRSTVADVERALAILADIVRDVDLLDKTPWIMFDKIEHGYFEVEFWYAIPRWTPKESSQIPNEYEKICRAKSQVNLQILKRFEAAGIRLAIPTEIHLSSGDKRPPMPLP